MRKKSEVLAEELETLRAELKVIDELEQPAEDDVARGNTLLEEWDTKKEAYEAALKYEERVEAIREASLDARRTESGSNRGPDLVTRNKRDPYENLTAVRSMGLTPGEYVSRGLDAVEQAPEYMTHDQREAVTNLISRQGRKQGALIARHCLLTGSEEYREAFQDYMADPTGHSQRAAMSLTNANGGYLVPFTLDPSIILTNSGSANPFRQISAIKTVASNTWNGVSSAGMNAAWLAENTIVTDNSPTFSNVQITPQKAAAWVFGSYEILEDSDFEQQVPLLLGDAKDRLEEAAFATGTGSGQPKGIITAATTTVTGHLSTGGGLDVADLYSVQAAVPPRFRRNASWVMGLSMINKARSFDTAGGSSYWTNLGQGQPERLLGGALYESTTIAAYVVTAGTKVAVYGDFAQYAIVDRIGMSVLYEPIVKGTGGILPAGQGGWFAFWRVGADALVPGAFRVLVTP